MHRKVIAFVGSLGIALVLAAVGVIYDAQTLLYGGVIILALVAAAWLFIWAHPWPQPAAQPAESGADHRRRIIAAARAMVPKFELQARYDWRTFVRYSVDYPAIRPHLSDEYKAELNDLRIAHAKGGIHDPLAAKFLDEVDRIEKKWGLA